MRGGLASHLPDRFGGARVSGSLGANAALPFASPPPELWAASSTAKAAEILIARFPRPLRGNCWTLALDGQITTRRVALLSSPSAKNISLRDLLETPLLIPAVPPRYEGRIAIVTNVERGMRWTLWRRVDERRRGGRQSRVVLIPRRWNQVGGDASHRGLRRRQKSPIAGESAE